MTMEIFLIKFDVWNVLNNNLSVLSWRIGFDQMIASLIRSPILGNGLGSTGFIEFESSSLNRLLSFYTQLEYLKYFNRENYTINLGINLIIIYNIFSL